MASGDSNLATSQIPGLSNISPDDNDEKRRNYIRESDSEYIKLAKQGGAKDLLSFQAPEKFDVAVDYPKSDWFGHHSMDSTDQEKILAERQWKAPDYMTHDAQPEVKKSDEFTPDEKPHALSAREERLLIQAKYNNRTVPYHSDDLSCWERVEEPTKRNRFHK